MDFMPHGHCYLWEPGVVWMQVLANGGIAVAYLAIFATLVYLVRRISDLPFQWMYVAFAVFIVTCGFTHLFDIYVIWRPAYWADGAVRVVTAIASLATAVMLPPLVPKAVALAEAARVSHERGLELEQVNRELAVLLDRTQEVERLKTQFFANVSHELRTPLTLILGPVERLLARADLDADTRRDVEVVSRNARTLLKHVNDLLEASKLEAGRVRLDYAEVDLAPLVRVVAAHFDGLARERGMTYTVDVPARLPGQVDAPKLERVLLNLLSNAFKFTPPGGRVRCAARAADGRLRLEVADSGPGIPADQREVVFERFRQVEGGATRVHGGTGLGLAIARDFVTLHGGKLSAGEAPEGGALLVAELPLVAPKDAVVAAGPTPSAETDAVTRQTLDELRATPDAAVATGDAGRPLVLVVEDNPDMSRFLREALAADYRVETAADGGEGLRRATELRPDLVLTDVMMPVLSGDQLVREARGRRELDGVPIIVLTAKADDELRLRLLREGAQDYINKPFSLEEVRLRVANHVRTKRARDVLRAELESQGDDVEALAREVTARKRDLETAAAALRVSRDVAERASRLKSDFLGMVSHEFRTPVTALQLQLERLTRDLAASASERQRDIARRMTSATRRLADMIELLLQHARLESGRLAVRTEAIDVRELARATVEGLRPQAEQKGLALEVAPAPDLPPLRSDPQLVGLILGNLVANAVKFTEAGGVKVSLGVRDGAHVLEVRDTGPGISVEDQARIFEPFEQLGDVRRKHLPGIGLGLALVRQLTGALGGEVELTSSPGAGSTFRVVLPPIS
jgi:signal transduction histidine kinase